MKKVSIWICLALAWLGCTRQAKPGYRLPDPTDVVIYEVNPRVFAEKESFKAIGLYLDSIKQLGANVLWFMPIYEIGREHSVNSPYCVRDYQSVNPEFGTIDDFKELVVRCHEKGLGVILDWVPNHTAWDHPWIKHKDWYTQDSCGAIIWPAGTGWRDVADLNYDNADMRLAMIEAMTFWVKEIGVDGFRCDAVDFVPADFLRQALDSLRSIPGHPLLMLAEGKRPDHFDAGFDLNYGWDFHTAMRHVYLRDSAATLLFAAHEKEYAAIPAGKHKLRFSTNHDETAHKSPVEEWSGERGSMSAFVAAAFMPGCPLLYSSQEVGHPKAINFFFFNPVDWSANQPLRQEYEQLLSIYHAHPALRKGEMKPYPDDNILLFERSDGKDTYCIAVNVRNAGQTLSLPPGLGRRSYRNLYTGQVCQWQESLTLKPYEYRILQQIKK